MRLRTIFLTASVPTILLLSAGGVVAYDETRPQTVADGISVGGVPIGGLSPAEAKAKLDREFTARLRQPIVVDHDKDSWTLGAKQAKLTADVDAMVQEAVDRSDEGGMLKRSWRRAFGGEVTAELTPKVTYSGKAVTRLVSRVQKAVDRDAVDATISLSGKGIGKTESRVGLRVKKGPLRRAIEAAITDPSAKRRFVATTAKLKPAVTTAELAKKNSTVLIASRYTHTVRLYKDLEFVKSWRIAAGSAQYPTPHGLFSIQNKAVNPAWSVPNSDWAGSLAGQVIPGGAPNNPLKARWMGVTNGVGFHGTSDLGSVGSNASHGCMRMDPVDVIDLYPRVPVGTPVFID